MAKILIGVALIAAGLFIPWSAPLIGAALAAMALAGASLVVAGIAQKVEGQHSVATGIVIRQAAAPWNVGYGRCRLGGTMIYAASAGFNNGFFRAVVAHFGHQIAGPIALYLDGREVNGNISYENPGGGGLDSIDENFYDWEGNEYNFYNYVHWEWRNGLPTAWPYTGYIYGDLNANDANWDSNCLCLGRATSYLRITYDSTLGPTVFPNGIPGIRIDFVGKNNIYDPRDHTYGYTENWALIVCDYLCNTDFGFGAVYATEIDEEQLIAAANICDEQIALATVHYPAFVPGASYALTQVVEPTTPNGYAYVCTTNGVAGAEPTWPTTVGANVTTGSAAFTCQGTIAGHYEPRYAVNGSFQTDGTPGDVLANLMTAAAGRVVNIGGIWKIFPGAWYGSNVSIGDNDLAGPIKWIPKRKFRDLVNAVKGTFICPTYPYIIAGPGLPLNQAQSGIFDGMWQATDFPVFQHASYLADDAGTYGTNDRALWAPGLAYALEDAVICQNDAWVCIAAHTSSATNQPGVGVNTATYWAVVNVQRLYQDLKLAFTISAACAQRVAKIYLMRNRQQGTGTLQCKLTALRTQAMDNIQWTHANFGFTNKLCEVSNFRFKLTPGSETEQPNLSVELDLQETDPSVYSWSTAEEQILYAPNASIPLGAQ